MIANNFQAMSTMGYDARYAKASPLLPKGEANAKGEDSLTQLLETLPERYRSHAQR
ncbi:MAG: hypothetical protein V7K50_27365 [Nostoc sp.]|uniref:hypothetical protein n=1 Tax=Nostoc sp. TaxID=1180 RepID=UPI002FF539E9